MKRLLIFISLFLMLLSIPCAAQQKLKFRVVEFQEDPLDLTAVEHEKLDANGDRYAVIKVSSANPDEDLNDYLFNFGYLNHITEVHDTELWVYVQRNAKRVTIQREGYQTIKDYDLKSTMMPGKTYHMILSSEAKRVYTQMVQFNVSPKGILATIRIKRQTADAKEEIFGVTDSKTGSCAKALEYGTYHYIVQAEDYEDSDGLLTLSNQGETHQEDVTLKANFGTVTLQVGQDADIYVDGQLKGRRIWTGHLREGVHSVECKQQYYTNSLQNITVRNNVTETFNITPPTPINGTLSVTSQPLGAKIVIDGKDYGVTPRIITDIVIGPHAVTLVKDGYKSETKNVILSQNETANLEVALSDMAPIRFESVPSYSSLYINGAYKGSTPQTVTLASGEYKLRLTHSGYQDYNKTVTVKSSEPTVKIHMKKLMLRRTCGYAQVGYQAGSLNALTVTAGMYLYNFNAEASFILGTDKSEDIYWTSTFGGKGGVCNYKVMGFGGKLGYGLILNKNIRLTPQVGYTLARISGDVDNLNVESATAAAQIAPGLRLDYALSSMFGLYVAPEYGISIFKGDTYEQLYKVSSKIKGWGEGFNVRLGVSVMF